MARDFAIDGKRSKAKAKEVVLKRALPGVHHPVFKGKPVNFDPREQFITEFLNERGGYGTSSIRFIGNWVQVNSYDVGASRYVFCVNVDAAVGALLLALLWKDYQSGAFS